METGQQGTEAELLEQAREQTRLLRSLQGYVMFWTVMALLGIAITAAVLASR